METNENNLIKQPDHAVAEPINTDEIKSALAKFAFDTVFGTSSKESYQKVYKEILPQLLGDRCVEDSKCLVKVLYRFGLDTHAALWESVSEKFGSLAMEFSKDLYEEYDCRTASEKALAQVAVNAFIRVFEYSSTLKTCMSNSVNTELTGPYSLISKELDRANRQFTTALTALKQIKTPPIKVNVKANNAFMAKNQQFNQNLNSEKIKPK
ncbi:MAG: hypothetical protein ABH846_02940 [Patescibacteria group bacterium]